MILGYKDSQRAIEIACNALGFEYYEIGGSMGLSKTSVGQREQICYEYDSSANKFVSIVYEDDGSRHERKGNMIFSKLLFRDFQTDTLKLLFNVDFRDDKEPEEVNAWIYSIYYDCAVKVDSISEALRICKNELFENAYDKAIESIEKQYSEISAHQPFGKPRILENHDLVDPEVPWCGAKPEQEQYTAHDPLFGDYLK